MLSEDVDSTFNLISTLKW